MMKDNVKPKHYRKGEIDLFESWYLTYPFEQYRAIMQSHAEKYLRRNKVDRVEDLGKAIYCLKILREKEIEHAKKNTKTPEEAIVDMGKAFGNVTSEWPLNKEDDESIYLLKGLLRHGFEYLARDSDNELWMSKLPPKKGTTCWQDSPGDSIENLDDNSFPEVKWTDEEPTKIADLLATYENGGENGKVDGE